MKHLSAYKNIALLTIFLFAAFGASAQQVWTQKSADAWVKSRVWANGLKLDVHPSTNNMEFAKQYTANKAVWDKAFEFIRTHNLDTIAPGKYPVDGTNAFATITEGPLKEFEKSAWESHRNYIDLQYVIKGKEKIGVAPVETATVTTPYDPAKDNANYTADGKYYIATPDVFFLFFPTDAHRPNIKTDGDKDKKLVIKIRVAQ